MDSSHLHYKQTNKQTSSDKGRDSTDGLQESSLLSFVAELDGNAQERTDAAGIRGCGRKKRSSVCLPLAMSVEVNNTQAPGMNCKVNRKVPSAVWSLDGDPSGSSCPPLLSNGGVTTGVSCKRYVPSNSGRRRLAAGKSGVVSFWHHARQARATLVSCGLPSCSHLMDDRSF